MLAAEAVAGTHNASSSSVSSPSSLGITPLKRFVEENLHTPQWQWCVQCARRETMAQAQSGVLIRWHLLK